MTGLDIITPDDPVSFTLSFRLSPYFTFAQRGVSSQRLVIEMGRLFGARNGKEGRTVVYWAAKTHYRPWKKSELFHGLNLVQTIASKQAGEITVHGDRFVFSFTLSELRAYMHRFWPLLSYWYLLGIFFLLWRVYVISELSRAIGLHGKDVAYIYT